MRKFEVIAEGLAELHDESTTTEAKPESKSELLLAVEVVVMVLYTKSGLKSGPKNVWELQGVEVDMGVLASEPRPSVDEDILRFRLLKVKKSQIKIESMPCNVQYLGST